MLLAGQELALAPTARGLDERMKGALSKAARAADFTGKAKTTIEILAPSGIDTPRLLLLGIGRTTKELDRLLLGGYALAQISARKGDTASLVAEAADPGEASAEVFAADLALGALLRSYTFKKYRTTRKSEDGAEEEPRDGLRKLVIQCAKPDAAAKAFAARKAVAEGVFLARDLVNEPANMLGPVEFAERMRDLSRAGVEVEVLDEDQLAALKMGALLARGAGQRAALARRRHAVARRQVQARQDAVLRRQGRVLRYRRHLHEAGCRHGGHEGRHGRGRLRQRPDAGARQRARRPSTRSA